MGWLALVINRYVWIAIMIIMAVLALLVIARHIMVATVKGGRGIMWVIKNKPGAVRAVVGVVALLA